jgi:tRNA (guanine37-N1)-methyltransferase
LKDAPAVLVQNRMLEETLRMLRKMQLLDNGLKFSRDAERTFIPLLHQLSSQDVSVLRNECGDIEVTRATFQENETQPKSLQELIREELPRDLLSNLPRSFDVIGDIAIIELPDSLKPFAPAIGNGTLKLNPRLRLVLMKSSDISGEYRTRTFEPIAGTGASMTVYHEFSCSYRLDVSRVYFNPRLSHERRRVAEEVKDGEHVVDMFAGVGPYSILIAKTRPHSTIHSIDLNPEAIKYLKENVLLNKVANRVIPLQGDARLFATKGLSGIADRVIMNLPSDAINFLDAACQLLKRDGGTLHYYAFASRAEAVADVKDAFLMTVENASRKIQSFTYERVIKEVAPNRVQVALDAIVR